MLPLVLLPAVSSTVVDARDERLNIRDREGFSRGLFGVELLPEREVPFQNFLIKEESALLCREAC